MILPPHPRVCRASKLEQFGLDVSLNSQEITELVAIVAGGEEFIVAVRTISDPGREPETLEVPAAFLLEQFESHLFVQDPPDNLASIESLGPSKFRDVVDRGRLLPHLVLRDSDCRLVEFSQPLSLDGLALAHRWISGGAPIRATEKWLRIVITLEGNDPDGSLEKALMCIANLRTGERPGIQFGVEIGLLCLSVAAAIDDQKPTLAIELDVETELPPD